MSNLVASARNSPVAFALALGFGWLAVIVQLRLGVAWRRWGRSMSREDEPGNYWFAMTVQIAALCFATLMALLLLVNSA